MVTFNKELLDDLKEKYFKVRKLLDDPNDNNQEGPDCETKNKAITILKEMKIKIENILNNSSDQDLNFVGMLAVVWLNIGIICIDNEELKEAEDNLMQCIEILKGRELEPQCILPSLSALNQLGIIWFQWGEYEKSKAFVEKSERLYTEYKNLDPVPEPKGMSSIFGIENSEEPTPQHVLEKLHALTLYYIAQVYGICKDHHKSALYCHMTLQKQLELTDLDYIDWALNAATLSQFFMEKKHFTQARHHLAAASHILKLYENSLVDDPGETANDEVKAAKWEQFHHRSADVARCWAKYGILLMSMSRDRLIELSENIDDEKNSTNDSKPGDAEEGNDDDFKRMKFEKLEENITPIAKQITDKYLLDFNDAKKVFLNVQQWLDQAKKYYALETHASDYVHIMQDMSQAYKYLSFFEDDEDRQAKMHKRRIDILEHVIKELNPRYYQSECRQIWIELGETYSAILDIKVDKLRASDDRPAPATLNKINQLCQSAIKYYQTFLDSLKESESAPAPKEFPEELVRAALFAYFNSGALYNRIITLDKNTQIENIKNSIKAYNFFIDYCDSHPETAELMKNELNVCKDLVNLLPLKLSKLMQSLSKS
ncbi:KIF-binding protein [Chelonus insularis]|uniref:KIF-binding protein n=1 Tax=Chelonus insularis TaxID=460826 RepID=UPI00158ADA04|nr:KIF-binding protein [Chelonus insularis]